MSSHVYVSPSVIDPYFALTFVNSHRFPLGVWLKSNWDWWVAPNIAPGETTGIITILEGATVEWQAVSTDAVAAYNLFNGTSLDIESEKVLEAVSEDISGW